MRLLTTIATIGLLSISAVASPAVKELNDMPFLQKANLKVKKIIDLKDIYQLDFGKGNSAFLTKDKKTIVFGRAFNTQTSKEIKMPVDLSSVNLKDEAFEFGKGKDEYIVFTDPECPYCQKFEKQWKSLEKKVKLHVFLFPLSFHKDSEKMSLYILSQKGNVARAKALSDITLGKKDFKKIDSLSQEKIKKLKSQLLKEKKNANNIGVHGTPTVYSLANGEITNWGKLQNKYHIKQKMNINPSVLRSLLKKSNYISLGNGQKTVFIFTDVFVSKKEFSKIQSLAKKYKVIIFLKPTLTNKKGLFKTIYTLDKKTNSEKFNTLKNFVNGKKLTAAEIKGIKQTMTSKDNSKLSSLQSLMVIGYAVEQLNIPNKTLFLKENGQELK